MSRQQDAIRDHADPRISVIITNYNYEAFLPAAIESVLGQTYPNVECIVVDDGSTDGSINAARRYPSATLISKHNGGQVSAVIEGVSRASGELIIFLDSDDTLYPFACSTVAAEYEPDVELYQYGLAVVNEAGVRIGSYPDAALLTGGQVEAVLSHGAFPCSPTSGNAFSARHVNRMVKRIGSQQRYFIDGYLIYSAPFFGRLKQIYAELGSYLVHGKNVSLSAGVNRVSAEKSLRNALWQREGIINALILLDRPAKRPVDYLTAWQYRYLLILRRCYGVRDIAPETTDASIAVRAIRSFAAAPNSTLKQKLQNMALIAVLMLDVTYLGKKIVPDRL
jgi:glycosyltransferase involved in cell wall biosynthesis